MSGLPRGNGMELFQRRVAVEHAFGRDRDGFVRNASPASFRDLIAASTPGTARFGGTGVQVEVDTFTLTAGAQTLTLSKLPIPNGLTKVSMQGLNLHATDDYTLSSQALSLLAAADARAGMKLEVTYLYLVDLPQPISGGDYPTAVKADSPLVYLRLNDAVGSTSAADSSGNGHVASSSDPPVFGQPTLLPVDDGTGAAAFFGPAGASATEYLQIPYGAWMDQPSFTIEAVTDSNTYIMGRYSTADPRIVELYGGSSFEVDTKTFLTDYGAFGATVYTCTGNTNLGVHHVAATYDGSSMRLFIDGSPVATTAAGPINSGSVPMTIGKRYAGRQWASGLMQEFAFYAGVLSDARILAHAQAGGFAV